MLEEGHTAETVYHILAHPLLQNLGPQEKRKFYEESEGISLFRTIWRNNNMGYWSVKFKDNLEILTRTCIAWRIFYLYEAQMF